MRETKSIIWTSAEADAVTGGTSTREWHATGVSLNPAKIKPGDLYIATPDDDLDAVFRKGATAALISGNVETSHEMPILKVASVFEALQSLAAAGRYKTHGMVVSVPSFRVRRTIHDLLTKTASVYEGGRHFSVGMAGIPEDVDYALFGSSPTVCPDIAVISNCAATNSDAIFETMSAHGSAIIHADSDGFLTVVARAKAAGVQNIFTYGSHTLADAKMCECVMLGDRMRVSVDVLNEPISFVVPKEIGSDPAFIAGLLVLKLTGQKLSKVAKAFDMSFDGLPSLAGDIAVLDPAASKDTHAVFRVKNMIDLGFGRQTAVLDGLASSVHKALGWTKRDLEIPARFASFDLVYTSRKISAVPDAHQAIKSRYKNANIETIAPDVIAPGDFLVFKDIKKQKEAIFSEALRLILPSKPKRVGIKHAL